MNDVAVGHYRHPCCATCNGLRDALWHFVFYFVVRLVGRHDRDVADDFCDMYSVRKSTDSASHTVRCS